MVSILFDLDGTLVDSQPGIVASWEAALRSLGHVPQIPSDISALIGPPMDEIMRFLLSPYGDDRVDEAIAAYRRDYGENGLFKSAPYEGIVEALASLKAAGAILYVATSKRTVFARRILEHLNLAHFFAGIYGSEPNGMFDHKPALIAHLLAQEELQATHCVMIGDRSYDIVGAHANKVYAVGALWGYGSEQELTEAGANWLAGCPVDLPEIVHHFTERVLVPQK